MSDVALPVHVARTQVASAIQLVVQIARFLDGSRKIRAISECLGLDDKGNYRFQDLYRFEARGTRRRTAGCMGEMLPTGVVPTFADEAAQMGYQDRVKLTRKLFPQADSSVVWASRPATTRLCFKRSFVSASVTPAQSARKRLCSQDKSTCKKQ